MASILLHTICLEPARWAPQKVSHSLTELLPHIAASGFRSIEIYEPHLEDESHWILAKQMMKDLDVKPAILSSYLNMHPGETTDAEVLLAADQVRRKMDYFEIPKVRLFPALRLKPQEAQAVPRLQERMGKVLLVLPQTEILLESHSNSLADDFGKLVDLIESVNSPQVGILFQPTRFDRASTVEQAKCQAVYVRHIHLQNRHADKSFARLAEGVIDWANLLGFLPASAGLTLEFVPKGICPMENFSLPQTLAEAVEEARFAASLDR